ncbi:hypothetical protein BU15DRAFT_66923 [Melanogaster broomeanus]|nr:hypothetical protein BU15DRAFT_66923 [Melanogaster broomeanus]
MFPATTNHFVRSRTRLDIPSSGKGRPSSDSALSSGVAALAAIVRAARTRAAPEEETIRVADKQCSSDLIGMAMTHFGVATYDHHEVDIENLAERMQQRPDRHYDTRSEDRKDHSPLARGSLTFQSMNSGSTTSIKINGFPHDTGTCSQLWSVAHCRTFSTKNIIQHAANNAAQREQYAHPPCPALGEIASLQQKGTCTHVSMQVNAIIDERTKCLAKPHIMMAGAYLALCTLERVPSQQARQPGEQKGKRGREVDPCQPTTTLRYGLGGKMRTKVQKRIDSDKRGISAYLGSGKYQETLYKKAAYIYEGSESLIIESWSFEERSDGNRVNKYKKEAKDRHQSNNLSTINQSN